MMATGGDGVGRKEMMEQVLLQAAERIRVAKYLTAFSGAGISVESGIPPFRGPGGIWNKYDPAILDLDVFIRQPERAWPAIKEMFLGFLSTEGEGGVQPNAAHNVLAKCAACSRTKFEIMRISNKGAWTAQVMALGFGRSGAGSAHTPRPSRSGR